eukprot:14309178-Heterocapsa_arctica.AAC.1
MRAEEERKEGESRARDQLQEGLARISARGPAQEGLGGGPARPPEQHPERPLPDLEAWNQEAGEEEIEVLRKRSAAVQEARLARE